jgi:predicted negative regulator of RcsB-dependent stress response
MAAYDLEEQEQIEELKTWWKQYGNIVMTIVLVASLALVGWQGWNWWVRNQSAQASAIYSQLQQAAGQRDAKRSRELAGTLIEKYSSTTYASMGAMVSAKTQVDAGDTKNARAQLEWVVANSGDESFRDIARIRLASVMLDESAFDEALKTLTAPPVAELKARHAELMGDIYAAQGKVSDARSAYERAATELTAKKESTDADVKRRAENYYEVVRAKIDSLATAQSSKEAEKK